MPKGKRRIFLGEKLTEKELADIAGVTTKTFRARLESGLSVEEAVARSKGNEEVCACGATIQRPTRGPLPLRCDLCEVEKRRAYARDVTAKRGAKPRGRYVKTIKETLVHVEKRKKSHRAHSKKTRQERKAAGLCQLCGERPATSRCDECKAKRLVATARKTEGTSWRTVAMLAADTIVYEWCPEANIASGW